MNEIENIYTIKKDKLDERNYFKTLIEEAYSNKMLTDYDIANLQIQFLQLLDERIYKYNGNDSSSIRKEIMENISNSNIYTISMYLKTFKNPDKAIKSIKKQGLKIAYQEGRNLTSIYLENEFCKKFSEEKIKYLLHGYSHDYKELNINIFEIALLETIACKLAKKNIYDLTISKSELNEIYKLFKNKEEIFIKNTIIKAYQDIINEMQLENQELKKYIEKNLDVIMEMIINAIEQKTLDKLFITQKII